MALLLSLTSPIAAKTMERTFDQRFNASESSRLDLSNVNGTINVEAWDRDEIWVRADMELEARDDEVAERAFRDFRIEVEERGDEIRIRTRHPKDRDRGFFSWLRGTDVESQVNFDVRVPRSLVLEISTVNGRVTTQDVGGELDLSTVNGAVRVIGSAGSVNASTVNGSIKVELFEVDPSARMKLSTVNGGIELKVPEGAGFDVKATTTNGRVKSDLPILMGEMSRERIVGQINGGGPELRLSTTNGSIRIKS